MSRAAIGSAAAALTLYQLALYCEQHSAGSAGVDASPASCSQVSNSLKQTSWHSLRSIAENGNTEVATYMLSQARAEARSSARSGSQATLATDALVALEGAAANRSLGAVRLLGMVYFDGIIVQPDIVKAYAFTRIYSEATGDPVMTGQTLKLFALLRQSDFNVAEKFIDDFEERLKR